MLKPEMKIEEVPEYCIGGDVSAIMEPCWFKAQYNIKTGMHKS